MLPQPSHHPVINRSSRRRPKRHRRGGRPTCSGADQLTSITDAKNQKTAWVYDTLNRITSEIDPLNKVTSYSYGATSLPNSRTDANGQTINYTYDALQRLTQKSYPDSSSTTFTYDSRNNILTAANSAISYSFTYDAANRIKTVTDSRGYSVSYDYDTNANRTKTTLQPGIPDQRIINYSYDDVNRLSTLTSPAGAFSFGYNLNNQRTTTSYPNQITASYSYDDAGRLTGITHTNPDTTIITSAGYTLDDVGNRTTKSGSTTESYSYDATYRILQAITPKGYETYSYDSVGNRTTGPGPRDTGYNHDAANRMTQGRQYSYSYDNNGNQTAKSINETKGWIQSWNYENRLITSERTKGAEKRTISFKYDPFGRRIEKKLVTTNPTTTETTTYVYDNEDIVLELTTIGSTTTKTFYTHGPGIDEPLAMERSGQYYYYHADGLGSITAISDAARTVVQRYSYSVFGQPRPTTGFRNAYQFAARPWDKETGLYYNDARYYDPMEGRFISRDPIGFAGGDVNLFGYVGNNSPNFTDPSGLAPKDKLYGLPPEFWEWYHRDPYQGKKSGDQDLTKDEARKLYDEWKRKKPGPDKKRDKRKDSKCEVTEPESVMDPEYGPLTPLLPIMIPRGPVPRLPGPSFSPNMSKPLFPALRPNFVLP